MFHKGQIEGCGYKEKAIQISPTAKCKRKIGDYGGGMIKGYVIVLHGEEVVSAGSAHEAWRKFVNYLNR